MKKNRLLNYSFLLAALLLGGGCGGDEEAGTSHPTSNDIKLPGALNPADISKTNSMKIFAHYMPWFETPATTGNNSWGQHWTMATCDPNQQNTDGKRQIASHYYPQIGPYASSDGTVLNYHALLMKYSGIDGVMIDWYGTQDKYDYADNKRNTEELVKALDRVGLQFAIVYEDQTVKELTDNNVKEAQAVRDLHYLQSNFFKKNNYVKIDNRPLLMVFGPQGINTPQSWNSIFSNLAEKPVFIVLNNHSGAANNPSYTNSEGEYTWVNPNPDYTTATTTFHYYIGGAMPGFLDYYKQGNWGDGYTTYDHENGALFDRQLEAARNAHLEFLQISTWNDFGEGTNIEPTLEYGYRYLTKLQQFTGIAYQKDNLELIHRWYKLKVKHQEKQGIATDYLTQAFYYLIALQPNEAEFLIETVENMNH